MSNHDLAAVLVHADIGATKPRRLVAAARAGRISVLAMGSTFAAVAPDDGGGIPPSDPTPDPSGGP